MTGESYVVYAVVFANYEPMEVHSLWSTRKIADRVCADLNGGHHVPVWAVAAMTVGTALPASLAGSE